MGGRGLRTVVVAAAELVLAVGEDVGPGHVVREGELVLKLVQAHAEHGDIDGEEESLVSSSCSEVFV